MNGVLSHAVRLYWAEDDWANKISFVMIHAPDAGSIAQLYWLAVQRATTELQTPLYRKMTLM